MTLHLRIKLALTAFLALTVISPVRVEWWSYTSGFEQVLAPGTLSAIATVPPRDLDGNGLPETLQVADGQVQLMEGGRAVWLSPPSWQVRQAGFSDLNHDGVVELALLIWRPFQPWLVDRFLPYGGRIDSFHDASMHSCHLILIGWKLGAYREVWAGSPMVDPLQRFFAVDLDGDGFQELAASEGRYDDKPGASAWSLSIWAWNGFGFSLADRLEGTFTDFQPLQATDGGTLLLVQRPIDDIVLQNRSTLWR